MELLKSLVNLFKKQPPQLPQAVASSAPTQCQKLIFDQATALVEQVNESIQLAHNSINPETKVSRLELAKAKLQQLQLLSAQYPLITITKLDGMLACMERMGTEFSEAGHYAKTDESARDYRHAIWRGINTEGIISGWRYSATMQLQTPLRVLSRHGEFRNATDGQPEEELTQEGCWLPVTKTFQNMGINLPELQMENTMASDIGPIPANGGEYLEFLLSVRGVVECNTPLNERLDVLREQLKRTEWGNFCKRLGGKEAIYSRFFPSFIECIPKLPSDAVAALWGAGLTTPAKLVGTPDSVLLAIKGIGPAKLKILRQSCANTLDKESERIDMVGR